jgi:hypothetical protein
MTTLIDTVRIEAPTRPPVRPTAPLDAPWDTATEPRSLERSFEVESRGGFARTVVGRLAYFDDEAQTYMVLTRDRVLVRVPLRDITARPPDGVRAGAPGARQRRGARLHAYGHPRPRVARPGRTDPVVGTGSRAARQRRGTAGVPPAARGLHRPLRAVGLASQCRGHHPHRGCLRRGA